MASSFIFSYMPFKRGAVVNFSELKPDLLASKVTIISGSFKILTYLFRISRVPLLMAPGYALHRLILLMCCPLACDIRTILRTANAMDSGSKMYGCNIQFNGKMIIAKTPITHSRFTTKILLRSDI